jgi:hypothetical protein
LHGRIRASSGKHKEVKGSDNTMAEKNTNRTVMVLAATVVVLLVAFVGVVMLTLNGNSTQTAQTAANTSAASTPTTATQQGMSSSTSGAFDPATATKVPAKQTPKDFVAAYYQAILDKKWDVAFKMQPAASQQGQTVAAFQQTQEQMYGITAFSIFNDTTTATDSAVVVRLDLGTNGIWNTTWNFVNQGGTWLVKDRSKIATGEPTK